MNKSKGRPKLDSTRADYLEVRLSASEKETFRDAATHAGLPISAWVRERLRRSAVKELEEAALPIAFLKEMSFQ